MPKADQLGSRPAMSMVARITHRLQAAAGGWSAWHARLPSLIALALLSTVVSGWVLAEPAEAAGPATAMSVSLSPSSIAANGTSTTTATATVTDSNGLPVGTDSVVFASSDPNEKVGVTTNSGNGTYTAQITSSTAVGLITITATDGDVTAEATLVQGSNTLLVASQSALVTNERAALFAAVSSATGSPSGTITFNEGGAPIAGCVGESITPSNPAATCQTSFAASTSPEQVAAVFTPNFASPTPGSTGAITLIVKPDSTSVSLDVSPTANAGQSTTYTATVTPPAIRPGPVEPTGSVEFFDNGRPIPSCLRRPVVSRGATCTLTYKALGTHTITARYLGDSNFTGSTSPAQPINVVAGPAHLLGYVSSTMQWIFTYTATYTQVLALVVNGTSAGASVVVRCHGGGCPFAKHTIAVPKRLAHGSINLASPFQQHPLQVAARITVVISRPDWISKYYAFTIRARQGPSIQISCLAPGRTQPGVGC